MANYPHYQMRDISELNIAVQNIISWMASSGQFPDPAIVQYNLTEFHPEAIEYMAKSRMNPDSIPALIAHKKLIQNINARFWGYAMVNPVVTLADLQRFLTNPYSSLGPIYSLPVAKQVFGVTEFHPAVIHAFNVNDISSNYRPTVGDIMDEIIKCYNKNKTSVPPVDTGRLYNWWESVFTRNFLSILNDPEVPNEQTPLDLETMKFNRLGIYGIRIRGFTTLFEALRSALSPKNYLSTARQIQSTIESDMRQLYVSIKEKYVSEPAIESLRRMKPKSALKRLSRQCRNLYNALQKYSQERKFTWPDDFPETLINFSKLLANVAERGPLRVLLKTVLLFADYSPGELEERICLLEDDYREKSLEEIVHAFNNFFDSFLEHVRDKSADPQVPWEKLAALEKTLSSGPLNSLLSSLASASAENYTGLKPKCLFVSGQVVKPQIEEEEEQSNIESKQEVGEVIDLPRLRNFLQHLTFITERSAETLLEISAQNLNIPRAPNALQTIRCILTDLSISSNKCSLLIHPQQSNFLVVRRMCDFQMPSELFTQRSAVLSLLSSCPVLQDPEIWSLWSYCSSSSLASHWGSLEEFLTDASDEDELLEKYNLCIVKLVGHGYLRLSTNGTPRDLIYALLQSASGSTELASSAAVKLCDLLTGSVLLVNRFIPPSECIQVLSSQMRSLSEDLTWHKIITSLLRTLPLPLLGVVFSKILQPALSENLITLQEPEGIERILTSSSGTPFHDHLVTSVGVVGGLLGWPVWLDAFKKRRLSYSHQQPAVRTSSSFDQRVETKSPKMDVLLPVLSNNAESVFDQQDQQEGLANYEILSPEKKSESPVEVITDCREFIENLRRSEFGLGADLNSEASGLLKRFESRLNRSLDYLSRQLYGQPGHFILELIQNADDNTYASGVTPSVHFHLSDSALIVRNNEATGFTQADISALCDVGLSTKIGNREDKTGRKGIGFKSVFAIFNAPEVHSNGFHVRFGCLGGKQQSATILTPIWIPPPVDEDQTIWRTCFRLPFTSETVQGPSSILSYARNLLNHHLILFLRRVDSIIFQTDQKLSESLDLHLKRESRTLNTLGGKNPSVLKLFTVTETRDGRLHTSKWLLLRKRFAVDVEKLSKVSGSTDSIPNRTDIAIAIPLATTGPLPTFPVYAFLPVRNVGFNFLLNADFDLTSSREDIDGNSVWNQFLVSQIPDVFRSLVESVIQIELFDQLPLSGSEILGRILECLPLNYRSITASTSSIFSCLEERICKKLSSTPWLPVLNGTGFAKPNNVLLPPQNPNKKSDLSSPENFLLRLLVDRRGMQELDPAFFFPPISSTSVDDEIDLRVNMDLRVQKLNRLGVQRVSADALIELASKLSEDELQQPGVLYILLANIDSGLRSLDSQHFASLAHRSAWQRRCLCKLRTLRIFPLTDGRLVSLDECGSSDSEKLKNRNCLMIPPKSPVSNEKTSKISYDKYINLLSRLGPLLSVSAIYPPEACNLSPPLMLFSTNDELSLGITIANSPLDVITKWIIPHQSDFDLENNDNADWFIAATQLLVIHGDLSKLEAVISHLPIVCEIDNGMMSLCSPSKNVIFTPLPFLARLPDQEEYEIMSVILQNKGSSILMASSEYFDSLDLADEEIRDRWQGLFSIAGVSTIQTLTLRRYCLEADPSGISVLPEDHSLQNSPALTKIPDERFADVIIEDWNCPGLEDLILPWIEQVSAHFVNEELVMTVCTKMLSLLDRNWKSNFRKCISAIARISDSKESIGIGASSWLQALRTRRWLIVSPLKMNNQIMVVAATDDPQSAISIDFSPSFTIYSPEAFTSTEISPASLSLVCSIWKPLRSLERPLSSNFLDALGVKVKLDESTFKSFVDYLSSKKDNLPSLLSLDEMVQVYRLAQDVLRDSPPDILREIFSSVILVPCTNSKNSYKKRKVTGSLCSIDVDDEKEYPVYCQFCDHQTNGNDLKRPFPYKVNFHLVTVDRTCWKAAKLPALEINPVSESDAEEGLVKVPLPSVNLNLSIIPRLNVSESRVELCNIYNDNCKLFFCDVLKVPKISSLNEVLSMRPIPPKFETDLQWRSAQEAFGRTLGAWYALIRQSLEVDGDDARQICQLRKFPLLYDMNGNWRTPCQINTKMVSQISEDELIFCWSATDLAGMIPRNCVLGHSLDNLSADFSENPSGSIPDSHCLLLKILALPVLEKSVSVNLDMDTVNMITNSSRKLDASLKFFRLLTKVWLSSSSVKASKANVSEFITAPKIGSEAFLVPALTLRLQLSNSDIGWTIERVPCRFCSGSLHVDSRLEPGLQVDANEDCISLLVGDRESIKEKVLIELTRAVFPSDLRNQLLLLNFSNGLLNLRSSLMASGLSSQNVNGHLRTFLNSHGIPSSNPNLKNLLNLLVSEAVSPATSTPTTSAEKAASSTVSVVTAHLESIPLTTRGSSLSTMSEERGAGTYTRFQTPMFEAISAVQRGMSNTSGVPSLRSSLEYGTSLPNSTYVDVIGYEGEKFVYQSFLGRIHRGQDFDFPTGHSELGSGRLVKAEWLNCSSESQQPYDIEIYLEVKGSIDRLDSSFRKAISAGVIKQSPCSNDLLFVGPIFVEVKSTSVASSSVADSFKERGDLFEISLAEVSYAQTMDWRFHVVRYRLIRDEQRSEMLHIPNLALALSRDPQHFQIYIGIRG